MVIIYRRLVVNKYKISEEARNKKIIFVQISSKGNLPWLSSIVQKKTPPPNPGKKIPPPNPGTESHQRSITRPPPPSDLGAAGSRSHGGGAPERKAAAVVEHGGGAGSGGVC
jgi:hypothetical protein